MAPNPSGESAISSVDSGSPFGSILDKFEPPIRESARKTSASFKVLNKNAVSNSPFLNGGNTSSVSQSPTNVRKPFSPIESSNYRQGQSQWSNGNLSNSHTANNVASSPARHGLGLLSKSTPASQASPAISAQSFTRIPHRRNNSDAENQFPDEARHNGVTTQADALALSPATQFNAEMEHIGAPPAMDVTYSSSGSSAGNTPELQDPDDTASFKPKKGPRPSVASLGHRGAVSSSPFLQQGSPASGHATRHRHTDSGNSCSSYSSAINSPIKRLDSPNHSALAIPRRGSKQMLGPREPSFTDLRAHAQTQDQDIVEQLADEYDEDTPIQPLTEANLDRKASRKSVKWAEVEEVCEFDVETEEGESRRSSGASNNSLIVDGYSSIDEDTDGSQGNEVHQAIVKAEGLQYEDSEREDEEYYDNYRHPAPETLAEDQEDMPVHASLHNGIRTNLPRNMSIVSEHASIVEHPADSSASSYNDDEDDLQKLIRKVEGDVVSSRSRPLGMENDVFGREFGVARTPKTSDGSSSLGSETSTPQALNVGSASRRPLPPPPIPIPISLSLASPGDAEVTKAIRSAAASTNMYLSAGDSNWDLPQLDLHNSPLLSPEEMILVRKESSKRPSPKLGPKNSPQSALAQEILPNSSLVSASEESNQESLPIERSMSPRPRLTADEVRESLRKRLGTSFASADQSRPLASTPPSGSAIATKSALPAISKGSNTARAGPSKAISVRPAPSPVKISTEDLPTLRTVAPSTQGPSSQTASATSSHESPLDRLAREASKANTLQTPLMRRGRSNSSSSSGSIVSFHSADSQRSDGRDMLKRRDEALLAAKGKKRGISPARPGSRRRSLSTGNADLEELKIAQKENVSVRYAIFRESIKCIALTGGL